ncbi:glycosyltransferase [Foetidibacter luteolus]|uniref:glycosyltransferase n=1 Tax=Foetidibacter luteolus TaxID=2608880 RepID=UPI00129B6FE3|nr:glycosyltransferase [Foetidibacter luteolus]
MISIVLPALNEGATIRKVIQRIRPANLVHEIIVVDDNSADDTVEQAQKEQVRVITSSRRGKGISMHEGMIAARYDIIVYLDADILTYPKNIVELLAQPILNNEADFVKSYFERQAGRVTQLVAKPLLSIFFPELEKFQQPLSGMVAVRKSMLKDVDFENDYGVDIALLIDAHHAGLRIKEVNIGYIKNAMQTLEALGKMSRQVSRTILQKASFSPAENFETLANIHKISDEMDYAILESINRLQKMVIIDMNALLETDFLLYTAAANNWEQMMIDIYTSGMNNEEQLHAIAAMYKGKSLPEMQQMLDSIPLLPDARATIRQLKKKGYICVLVSNGFDVVASHLKNKLGFDYSFANKLVMEKSIATGELKVPDYFRTENIEKGTYSKAAILDFLSEKFKTPAKNMIYVGCEEEDITLIQNAGLGIVLSTATISARLAADEVIKEHSLKPLLQLTAGVATRQNGTVATKIKRNIGIAGLTAAASLGVYFWLKKSGRFNWQ